MDRWKAVRKGGTYCAPACGRGCTHDEYVKALQKGKNALKLLKNKEGWKVRVWENLGWHVSLEKGGMSLHISEFTPGKIEYSVLFSADGRGGGESFWTMKNEDSYSTDPNVVIQRQIMIAQKFVRQCTKAIEQVVA